MNRPLPIIDDKAPLTLREHEEYVCSNSSPRIGESPEDYEKRLDERLERLRKDMAEKENRGTLRLMSAEEHRDRAKQLEQWAKEKEYDDKPEHRMCLHQAAHIHLHHARRLDAEAAEQRCADSIDLAPSESSLPLTSSIAP